MIKDIIFIMSEDPYMWKICVIFYMVWGRHELQISKMQFHWYSSIQLSSWPIGYENTTGTLVPWLFELDLHTLISDGAHVVLALFFHISIYIVLESSRFDFPIICICYFKLTLQILQINCKIFLDLRLLNKNNFFT